MEEDVKVSRATRPREPQLSLCWRAKPASPQNYTARQRARCSRREEILSGGLHSTDNSSP